MAKSIYDRVKELEAYIPQLDAAQTENANELLKMVSIIATSHNELVRCLKEIAPNKFDDLKIININEAMNDPI